MTTSVPERRFEPAAASPVAGDSPDRFSRMVEAASDLRARRSKLSLDTVLFALGSVCLPAGLAAIFAGWYGVAHTGFVWQQNSYLISGGILGLGLIIIGGFLFFGSWITRHIRATEAGNQAILAALVALRAPAAASTDPARTSNGTARPAPALPFVVTEKGGLFHKADCAVVAGKTNLRAVGPGPAGYRPCRVCEPMGPAGT